MVLYEPFGGLCAGLEMLLRNGVKVHNCYYSDIDNDARKVAEYRVQALGDLYPVLLGEASVADMFALPQDVFAVSSSDLAREASRSEWPWLVVAGFACQDLSSAGEGAGLAGNRSNTWFALHRILHDLHSILPPERMAYIVENTPLQYNWKHPGVRSGDFDIICMVSATLHAWMQHASGRMRTGSGILGPT